ncbi:hypothetical protein ACGE24_05465 [Corynebacterium kroppenstedtii]|uniref:hypothetical protein n=1 Tax=Corynebacterium sp. PCR 32 TaxID=3351342 RepID=UPI0030B32F23
MQSDRSVASLIRFIQMSYPHSNCEARHFFDEAVNNVGDLASVRAALEQSAAVDPAMRDRIQEVIDMQVGDGA